MKNNSKKIFVCILLIVAIVLIVSGFIIATSIGFSGDNKQKNDKRVASSDLTYEEYSKYYPEVKESMDKLDLFLGINYPVNDFSKLSNKDKTLFLLDCLCDFKNDKATVSDLETESKKYFENFETYKKTLKDDRGNTLYEYGKDSFKYMRSESDDIFVYFKDVSDAAKTDRWTFKRKVYYEKVNPVGDYFEINVYKTLDDAKNNNILKTFTSNILVLSVEEVETIEESLMDAEYVFDKVNDKYLIKSIMFN